MGEITISAVRDAVNQELDAAFPGVEIMGEEIKQGMQEPCFFVKLLEGEQVQELGQRYRRVHSFDIQYFGTGNRSLHDVAEKLYDAMEYVSIGDQVFRGTGMRHEIVDGVLHFFVDYNFLVRRPAEEFPKMQTLEQEGYLK